MSIRTKLIIMLLLAVLIPMLVSLSVTKYSSVKTMELATSESMNLAHEDIHHILGGAENLITANKNALDSSRKNGVKTFLRSAADLLYTQVDKLYKTLPAEKRWREIRKLILSGKFGSTGYAFGMNTKGVLTIHPKSEGKSLAGKTHIDEMTSKRNGFISYTSATTGREKVVYYRYFEPLDLIIAPGSFVDELSYIIDQEAEQASVEQMYSQLRDLKVGKNGFFWVANSNNGDFIVTPVDSDPSKLKQLDKDKHGNSYLASIIDEALNQQSNAIAEKKTTITNPITGTTEEMILNFKYYAPLQWVIGTALPEKELLATSYKIEKAFNSMNMVVMLATVILLVVAILVSLVVASKAIRPIKQVQQMANEMAMGHFDLRLNMKSKDELGEMAAAMDSFADDLQLQVVSSLNKLANGDLSFSITPKDERDQLRGSIEKLSQDLNVLMAQILSAGDQISSGSTQVSDSAQSLSQGATEAAASIEEIGASVENMADQTKQNAENANIANKFASAAMDLALRGNQQMIETVSAMDEIRQSSENISKIIKVIDEIAFQTNLLALNAAVEAARAGQHGKGFAVVAEEVRNLAARSAKAAQETAALIDGSVNKTKHGASVANQTSLALQEIVQGVTKVSNLIQDITTASNEQARGVSQINQGLGQIDDVIQQNTAVAEESAATSEELSSQSLHLKSMLAQFNLKESKEQQMYISERQRKTMAQNQT
ncbi:MAG: hypothetical protein B6I36_03990 [Desulfobacteraceae bacterium 4572_35.1]|nr:MAG: hypothetical protein B6I36_03990 [Desulfobacteraceae bacterium 4572_35.1]